MRFQHVESGLFLLLAIPGTVQAQISGVPETVAGIPEADCQSGGFDIAANMVHTGWAVADPVTGRKYATIEARARKAGRGLWRGEFSLSGRDN